MENRGTWGPGSGGKGGAVDVDLEDVCPEDCMLYLNQRSSFSMTPCLRQSGQKAKKLSGPEKKRGAARGPQSASGSALGRGREKGPCGRETGRFVVNPQRSPQRSSGAARGTEEASFHPFCTRGTFTPERFCDQTS